MAFHKNSWWNGGEGNVAETCFIVMSNLEDMIYGYVADAGAFNFRWGRKTLQTVAPICGG